MFGLFNKRDTKPRTVYWNHTTHKAYPEIQIERSLIDRFVWRLKIYSYATGSELLEYKEGFAPSYDECKLKACAMRDQLLKRYKR